MNLFLEAQLLYNYTDSLSTTSPLFVHRFGRSLQFFRLEFDMEAIYDGWRSEKA